MSKEEISELEGKISELQKELELWKAYRELKEKIDNLKKEPTTIPYVPYMPTYPVYPTYPTYRIYPWYKIGWPTCGDNSYGSYSGLRTTSGG
jgi:hypothetical protein